MAAAHANVRLDFERGQSLYHTFFPHSQLPMLEVCVEQMRAAETARTGNFAGLKLAGGSLHFAGCGFLLVSKSCLEEVERRIECHGVAIRAQFRRDREPIMARAAAVTPLSSVDPELPMASGWVKNVDALAS
eukprot:1438742-Pleurochrysis_carterae.AAC.1